MPTRKRYTPPATIYSIAPRLSCTRQPLISQARTGTNIARKPRQSKEAVYARSHMQTQTHTYRHRPRHSAASGGIRTQGDCKRVVHEGLAHVWLNERGVQHCHVQLSPRLPEQREGRRTRANLAAPSFPHIHTQAQAYTGTQNSGEGNE
jgi:hypothetical protein